MGSGRRATHACTRRLPVAPPRLILTLASASLGGRGGGPVLLLALRGSRRFPRNVAPAALGEVSRFSQTSPKLASERKPERPAT